MTISSRNRVDLVVECGIVADSKRGTGDESRGAGEYLEEHPNGDRASWRDRRRRHIQGHPVVLGGSSRGVEETDREQNCDKIDRTQFQGHGVLLRSRVASK